MPTQTTLSRVESFPFDSRSDGYDADGYPVYDRAVGASMLRETFKKFFSDGVFPSPGNALQISKGPGLTVTIDPGIFIIRGAMGGYFADARSVALDTAAPQGNVAYGVMLRYDENEQYRSCYIRVVRGDAASMPQPPEPDKSTPGVMEYRLGYVTVPSGATNLSNATVTNEKGTDVCPYAAPFEKIDMSGVVADARASADEVLADFKASSETSLDNLQQYVSDRMDLIDSALDGTTAGNLQNQIDSLGESMLGADSLDPKYLAMQKPSPDLDPLLGLVEWAVGTRELEEGAVTRPKLDPALLRDLVSTSQLADLAEDLAIVAFNATVGSIVADQKTDNVYIWEFPDDVDAGSTQYDSGSNSYYVVGA